MGVTYLSAAATLDLWQTAEELGSVERPLALAAVVAAASVDELAGLPLGRRDAWLLELHTRLGRPTLEATAPCPACGEAAEFAVDAQALLARGDEAVELAPVERCGLLVGWRPLDSRDLAAAGATGDAAAAEHVLLSRCVTEARGPEGEVDGASLPAEVRAAVAAAMAEADPLAEVLVDVLCPACETAFAADLDLASFVWAEVRTGALALLRDVDTLARAYGWTESEVLALDGRRRAAYLELAREGAP
jgi:hypothetical protein